MDIHSTITSDCPLFGVPIQSVILKGCKMFPHIHFQLEENDIIIQHLPVLRLKKIVKFAQKPSAVDSSSSKKIFNPSPAPFYR